MGAKGERGFHIRDVDKMKSNQLAKKGENTNLFLFGAQPRVLLTCLFSRLCNIQLLMTRSLVALNPIREIELPRGRSQLRRFERGLEWSYRDV